MSQQVRQQQSSAQGLRGDQSAMTADLETLRQHRTRLEAVVVDAQRLIEEKVGHQNDDISQHLQFVGGLYYLYPSLILHYVGGVESADKMNKSIPRL